MSEDSVQDEVRTGGAVHPDDVELIAALEDAIPRIMAVLNTPGANVALGRRGEIAWEQGFGYSDVAEKKPVTPESVGKSGSTGKTYTATAVMQLVERGALGLDDPINKYLPFEVVNPLGDRDITVRDLLTHRSGLAEDAAGSDFAEPDSLGDVLVRLYSEDRSDFYYGTSLPRWASKVGENAEYSNLGIATLGYLVELANPEKLTFSAYVQRNIMDRLGMTAATFPPVQSPRHVSDELLSRLTKGYAGIGAIHVPTPEIYFGSFPAGTAIYRPSDHLRLLLAYMGGGTFQGKKLLEKETVELMLSPQVTEAGPKVGDIGSAFSDLFKDNGHLGLVWFVGQAGEPEEHFQHGGAHMWGWTNVTAAYPQLDFAIVVMVNQWELHEDATWPTVPEGTLIARFASQWLRYERADLEREGRRKPWGWRAAYYVGLIMGDRLQGQLGIKSKVTSSMVDEMVAGVVDAPDGWDGDGFRAGLDDVMQTDRTFDGMKELLVSDRLRVAPAELLLLHRELGGKVGGPVVAETW